MHHAVPNIFGIQYGGRLYFANLLTLARPEFV